MPLWSLRALSEVTNAHSSSQCVATKVSANGQVTAPVIIIIIIIIIIIFTSATG